MNVAMGMWAIVLGGWVLPAPTLTPDAPNEAIDAQPIRQFGARSLEPERRPATWAPGEGAEATPPQQRYSSASPGSGQSPQARPRWAPQMPPSPTAPIDPRAASTYPLALPTTSAPPAYPGITLPPGAVAPPYGYPGTGTAYGGTAAGTSGYQSMFSPRYASQLWGSDGPKPMSRPSSRPSVNSRKPFANYRRPPAFSPYMNLFRDDTVNGLDNYNAFVRPAMEQGRVNQRFSGEIRGLQNATRHQGAALQGLSTPGGAQQRFMNHRAYFPTLPK